MENQTQVDFQNRNSVVDFLLKRIFRLGRTLQRIDSYDVVICRIGYTDISFRKALEKQAPLPINNDWDAHLIAGQGSK